MGPLRLFGWPIRACVLLVLIAPSGTGEEPKAPQYGPAVQKRLDALRAKGEPVTLDDLTPEPIPAEENAATIYRQAFEAYVEGDDELLEIVHERSRKPEEVERVRQWVQQNERVLALTKHASAMERCQFVDRYEGIEKDDHSYVFGAFDLEQLLGAAVLVHLTDGESGAGLEGCILQLRLAEHVGQGRSGSDYATVNALVKSGQRSMSRLLSSACVAGLDLAPAAGKVERMLHMRLLPDVLRAERVMCLHLLNSMGGSDDEDELGELPEASGSVMNWAPEDARALAVKAHGTLGAWREAEELALLEVYDRLLPLAEQAYYQTARERDKLQRWMEDDLAPRKLPMAIILVHGGLQTLQSRACREARLWQLALGIELEMHRRKTGSYPEALSELRLTYLDELPLDPFSGRAFVYRKKDGGYILYSVGPNGRDDGGVPGHPGDRTDDIVWSVTMKESN